MLKVEGASSIKGPSMSDASMTGQLQDCLARWARGEPAAREELLSITRDWLRRLVAVMLRDYPSVHRWEQTDDVLQNAMLRLWRALEDVRPATARDFCGLATLQMRRELVDLARHYFGPHGLGAHHVTEAPPVEGVAPKHPPPAAGSSCNPAHLAAWTDFHHQVTQLPANHRAAFEARWYLNLRHAEAAELLGVSVSTIIRDYQAACRRLNEVFKGELPFA
jgi:RNA polymerase sigma-70 factor (ECF subfamily)